MYHVTNVSMSSCTVWST